jgi:DNA-binding transcriptional regulator YdaS (Cro superfamily)
MSSNLTPLESLKTAVGIAGSQTAFAELCGVSQTAVWKWLDGGKHLPAEHVLKVEAATGVSRHELRPDIYPIETTSPAGTPAAALPGAGHCPPPTAPGAPSNPAHAAPVPAAAGDDAAAGPLSAQPADALQGLQA